MGGHLVPLSPRVRVSNVCSLMPPTTASQADTPHSACRSLHRSASVQVLPRIPCTRHGSCATISKVVEPRAYSGASHFREAPERWGPVQDPDGPDLAAAWLQ